MPSTSKLSPHVWEVRHDLPYIIPLREAATLCNWSLILTISKDLFYVEGKRRNHKWAALFLTWLTIGTGSGCRPMLF